MCLEEVIPHRAGRDGGANRRFRRCWRLGLTARDEYRNSNYPNDDRDEVLPSDRAPLSICWRVRRQRIIDGPWTQRVDSVVHNCYWRICSSHDTAPLWNRANSCPRNKIGSARRSVVVAADNGEVVLARDMVILSKPHSPGRDATIGSNVRPIRPDPGATWSPLARSYSKPVRHVRTGLPDAIRKAIVPLIETTEQPSDS